MKLAHVIAAALVTLGAAAAQAASVEAIGNATVQPGGVRTGGSGINFFNIEGADYGSFASYGAIRFDLSSLKAGFDAQYGVGGWVVDSVMLSLTQSNAAFTNDGGVAVYFTNNDGVSLSAPSPLTYDGFAADFADAQSVTSYTFTQVSSGTVDSYTLFSRSGTNSAGGNALMADILADSTMTLALRETDAGVAATYAGFNNNSYAGPTLSISVTAVPEPEAYALLLAGLGLVGAAARRRRA
jgi:hypothetical protein